MKCIYPIIIVAGALAFIGCAGPDEALVIKQFTLRDQVADEGGDPMVEHEKKRLLYGAVSLEERRGRLGQYYTAIWNVPVGKSGLREIIFQYQQGRTASRVKSMKRELPSAKNDGKQEFAVIGDDYFDNGRVLAWKMSLVVAGETIATKQSYLWE